MLHPARSAITALVLWPALAGCVRNVEPSIAPATPPAPVSVHAALHRTLPAEIRARGVLRVATSPMYPPNEYLVDDRILGWDIELAQAIAQRMGLRAEVSHVAFEQIPTALAADKFDIGISSFTDTRQRQASMDFVDYYSAGTQWAVAPGARIDPDDACGLRIAVQQKTWQATTDLPARSQSCRARGAADLRIQTYADQAIANNAVVLGKADAVLADSSVIANGVKQSGGRLRLTGPVYEAAPYGIVLAKGSPLTPLVQAAVQSLMDDGGYHQVLQRWGVEGGALQRATINGATR